LSQGIEGMKTKTMKVSLTYSWTFTEKEWKEEKEFLQKVKDNPRIVLGEDVHHMFYCMNDITIPEIKHIEVENVE
jgi:hypothetical protein